MEFELNEIQIAYLKRIRKVRGLFVLKALSALLLLPIFVLVLFIIGDGLPAFTWIEWKEQFGGIMMFLFVTLLVLALPFLAAYFFRLLPLQRDLNSGKAVKVNKQIVFKRHFPITNEYYFFFEEKYVPNIKVDALTYSHYSVGDYFSIKMTKRSKIIFEDFDRFEIV